MSEARLRAYLASAPSLTGVRVRQDGTSWIEATVAKSAFERLLSEGWYVQQDLKQFGPFTLQRVKELRNNGQIRPNALIRQGNTGPWRSIGQLDEASLVETASLNQPGVTGPRPRTVVPPVRGPRASPSLVYRKRTAGKRSLVKDLLLTIVLGVLSLAIILGAVWLTDVDNRELAYTTARSWLENVRPAPQDQPADENRQAVQAAPLAAPVGTNRSAITKFPMDVDNEAWIQTDAYLRIVCDSPHAFTRLPRGYLQNMWEAVRDKQLAIPGQGPNRSIVAAQTATATTDIKVIEIRERLVRNVEPNEIRDLLRLGAAWNENLPRLTFFQKWSGTQEQKQELIQHVFALGLAVEMDKEIHWWNDEERAIRGMSRDYKLIVVEYGHEASSSEREYKLSDFH